MVVVGERRVCVTNLTAASVRRKEALEAVYHPRPCDPGIIRGCSVRVYNDGFPQLHVIVADAHRLQRSSGMKVLSGSEGPQELTEQSRAALTTDATHRDALFGLCWVQVTVALPCQPA